MKRPGFGVVTLVLVVLCCSGIVANVFRPHIPPGLPNDLAGIDESFLRQGAYQPVQWHEASEEVVAVAKATKKPILVLIGSAASHMGRRLDETIFNQRDVAAAMNLSFICIRIDGLNHPDQANFFLPVSRVRSPMFEGFQCWVLDSNGALKYGIVSPRPIQDIDGFDFMQMLEKARLVVTGRRESLVDLGVVQQADIKLALDSAETEPNFKGFREGMLNLFRRDHFEVTENMVHRCWAPLWPALIAQGQTSIAHSALRNLIFSAQNDWVGGGFFHFARGPLREQVEFDKLSIENSELMSSLAQVGSITDDAVFIESAEMIADWLMGQMMQDDLFLSAQSGDEQRDGRSVRNSFSPARLRSKSIRLTAEERADVGLSSPTNTLWVPYVGSPAAYANNRELIQEVLSRLRQETPKGAVRTNARLAHVSGIVCARLFETGRLIHSPRMIRRAKTVADRLDNFMDGDDLRIRTDVVDTSQTPLSAYLGFADAMLQQYLATEDSRSIDRGVRMLNRAELAFQSGRSGVLTMTKPGTSPFPNTEVPEIADNTRESASAVYIRLLTAYGRILGDQITGGEFVRKAVTSCRALGNVTDYPATKLGAFFRSALFCYDPVYAVCVGPNRRELADQLFRRIPSRLVFPAGGNVRRDLQSKLPGIYVIRGPEAFGPFTVEQAASRMPLELSPSKQP